jgi:hypothetical protein
MPRASPIGNDVADNHIRIANTGMEPNMRLLLIILLILLVLGGGFGLHGGMFIGAHGLYYGGGLGIVILVVLVLLII